MWQLEKSFTFEASHQLPLHDGKCARMHGHSWVGKVIVRGNRLHTEGPKTGMLIDYADIKRILSPIVDEQLDHWHLNQTTELEHPTSEEIARWLFQKLKPLLPGLYAIVIDETATSSCIYTEE
jgi:6-pyruvoyltetrahydropterin/6-carboxytetrahydropterin synthase